MLALVPNERARTAAWLATAVFGVSWSVGLALFPPLPRPPRLGRRLPLLLGLLTLASLALTLTAPAVAVLVGIGWMALAYRLAPDARATTLRWWGGPVVVALVGFVLAAGAIGIFYESRADDEVPVVALRDRLIDLGMHTLRLDH